MQGLRGLHRLQAGLRHGAGPHGLRGLQGLQQGRQGGEGQQGLNGLLGLHGPHRLQRGLQHLDLFLPGGLKIMLVLGVGLAKSGLQG